MFVVIIFFFRVFCIDKEVIYFVVFLIFICLLLSSVLLMGGMFSLVSILFIWLKFILVCCIVVRI